MLNVISLWSSKCRKIHACDIYSILMGEQNSAEGRLNVCVRVCLQLALYSIPNCSRLGSPCCHRNQFWVFCLVIVGLKRRRLSENEPKVLRCSENTGGYDKLKKLKWGLLHATPRASTPQVIIMTSFDFTVRILWLQLFVTNCCRPGGPCDFQPFLSTSGDC